MESLREVGRRVSGMDMLNYMIYMYTILKEYLKILFKIMLKM